MPRTIIVSDLHVDTWGTEKCGKGDRRKTKLDHWTDFLDWCAAANIDELVINGDLMDAPPYKGNVCFTTGPARQAVEKLLAYAKDHPVTYIYGNHDIGISGLRCPAGSSVAALANINLCYPRYCLPATDSMILFEHGHFYDPALIAYTRDLLKRTYVPKRFEELQWAQQRRDPETGERREDPGVSPPSTVDLERGMDNNLYFAIRVAEVESPTPEAERKTAQRFLKRLKRNAFPKAAKAVKHYLWWEAAKDTFSDYLKQTRSKPQTLYCVMGHTHVPDWGEITIAGVRCVYFNSVTWTCSGDTPEDRSYATYLYVRDDGKMRLHDWVWNRHEEE